MSTTPDILDVKQVSLRRSMAFLAIGALAGLMIAGYGLFTAKGTRTRAVPPEAIAMVNQRPILRSDFMTQTQVQFAMPFPQTSRSQRAKVIEDMVNEELTMQRGLEIDLPSYDPDVRNALVAGVELEVTAEVLAQQPTDAQLRAYYRQHQDRYASEGVMQLRDLLVARDVAAAARAALRSGAPLEAVRTRFGLVDSDRFKDSGKVDTGDIFQFAVRAKGGEALYAAALPLKDGEVSAAIEQADGLHLIYMVKHRFPVAESFEQANNRVWNDVKSEAQAKVKAANLAYLRSRADIVVAPEYAP